MTTDAAIWLRVSTEHQHEENQLSDLKLFCRHHRYRITARYEVSGSAWTGGREGGEYQRTIARALDDAWQGKFSVLVVWSLSRLTRGGAEDALRLFRQFRERDCTILSVKDSWLNGSPAMLDVLLAFGGWQAKQESDYKADQIRAGMERARAEGKQIGRPARARDPKPRKLRGPADRA